MFILILWLKLSLLNSAVLSAIHRFNEEEDCDTFSPDAVMGIKDSVRMSRGRFPFRINLSSDMYGNQSAITVNIEGPINSSFIVQMKPLMSDNRVGLFKSQSESQVQSIVCQEYNSRIMATMGPLPSTNVSFQWSPPSTDKGIIVLMGIFVSGDEYWVLRTNGPKLFYHQQKTANQSNGCVARHGDNNLCKDTECEYRLIYQIIDNRTTMKVKMRSDGMKKDVYMGLALANNENQEIREAMMVSCLFTGTSVKVNSTNIVNMNSPRLDFDNKKFSCVLLISLKNPDKPTNNPSHVAYFWGNIDPSTGEIILPPSESIKESFQPISPNGSTGEPCHFKYIPLVHGPNSSSRHFISSTILIVSIIMCHMLSPSVKIPAISNNWMNYKEFKTAPR